MGEISEAWETLGDPKKREEEYDRRLSGSGKNEPFAAGGKTGPRPSRPITQEEFARMSRAFDDILSPDAIKKSGARNKGARPRECRRILRERYGFQREEFGRMLGGHRFVGNRLRRLYRPRVCSAELPGIRLVAAGRVQPQRHQHTSERKGAASGEPCAGQAGG